MSLEGSHEGEAFAMTHLSEYQEEGVAAGDHSYGSNDGNEATVNDFSDNDLDNNYQLLEQLEVCSPQKRKHCLFLEDS